MQVTAHPATLQPIFMLGDEGIIIHGRWMEKAVPPSAHTRQLNPAAGGMNVKAYKQTQRHPREGGGPEELEIPFPPLAGQETGFPLSRE